MDITYRAEPAGQQCCVDTNIPGVYLEGGLGGDYVQWRRSGGYDDDKISEPSINPIIG